MRIPISRAELLLLRIAFFILTFSGCSFAIAPVGTPPADGGDLGEQPDFSFLTAPDLAQAVDFSPAPDLAPANDLATPPDLTPPADLEPPSPLFIPDVQADLDRLGCAAAACHAVYSPLLYVSPSSEPQRMQNYANFKAAGQLVLLKNLVGDGTAHAGSADIKPFLSEMDATYVRWKRWIDEGQRYK